MKVTLSRLEIKDWKGFLNFVFEPGGLNADVRGRNRGGKTTLFDAYSWLLFDKDSLGASAFDIKRIEQAGQAFESVHNVSHTVTGDFFIDGDEGQESTVAFKKVYKEKWTQKRGTTRKEFSGHETKHWVDGVPVNQTEYKKRLADLINLSVFQLVSDPMFFAGLEWTKQRDLFLGVFDDTSMDEIVDANPSLNGVLEVLGNADTDDRKRALNATLREINQELKEIPARIDELTLQKKPDEIIDNLKADLIKVRETIKGKESDLSEIKNNDGTAPIERKIKELVFELNDKKMAWTKGTQTKKTEADEHKAKCQKKVKWLADAITELNRKIKKEEDRLKTIADDIARLEKSWRQLFSAKPDLSDVRDSCPACGQSLPDDQIGLAMEKARSKFEADKARELKKIEEDGKHLAEQKTISQDQIEKDRETLKQWMDQVVDNDQALQDAQKALDLIQEELNHGIPLVDAKDLEVEIDRLKKDLEDAEAGQPNLEPLDAEIKDLKSQEENILNRISEQKNNLEIDDRIKQLSNQEKSLSKKFEETEADLAMINELVMVRATALTDKINRAFKVTRFRLFETQINEGIKETFVICNDEGVPWGSMNSASRRLCGIDIINVLSKHYNLYVPVWIDNAESITDWMVEPEGSQFFRLLADCSIDQLTIETR